MTEPLLLMPPKKKSRLRSFLIIVLIVFAIVGAVGIVTRIVQAQHLKKRTDTDAIPVVSVITAERGALTEELTLPGTVQAWHEATVYARTAGYLKSWNVDIGAHVKEGEVLGEIDAPDLDAQYRQAKADLGTAEANNQLAQITAKRWLELLKTDSVSKQDADTKVATAEADAAAVESAKANVDHLQQQEDFKTIIAPFEGTITERNVDVGALINGGNSGTGTGQDLFHVADTSKLRVYVQVPENDAGAITTEMTAELNFPQSLQQAVTAKLARTADALDPTTRTLLVQLEVDNADGALLSGGYTEAKIKTPTAAETLIVPVNTLLFRDKERIGVVKNNHVALQAVTIGRDYGKKVEVVSGISVGDIIVINPPDSLQDGQEVRVAKPDATNDQAGNKDQKGQDAGGKTQSQEKNTDTTQDNPQEKSKDISKDGAKDDTKNSTTHPDASTKD